jgi:hypothetical protein
MGIKLVDKEKIDSQNNVLKFVMKTMKKNLFSGKSILSISLPVEIFKADSNTQRPFVSQRHWGHICYRMQPKLQIP